MNFNKLNNGYQGYSMSNRAVEAYENGEMPLSKWTKQEIIDKVEEYDINFNLDLLKKLTKSELVNLLLKRTSWHHTSSYCNTTSFYSINETELDSITDLRLLNIIASRETKQEKQKKEKVINKFITAKVSFYNWEGSRNHPKKKYYEDIVKFRTNDLTILTCVGNKRLSSLTILKKVENDTKFLELE